MISLLISFPAVRPLSSQEVTLSYFCRRCTVSFPVNILAGLLPLLVFAGRSNCILIKNSFDIICSIFRRTRIRPLQSVAHNCIARRPSEPGSPRSQHGMSSEVVRFRGITASDCLQFAAFRTSVFSSTILLPSQPPSCLSNLDVTAKQTLMYVIIVRRVPGILTKAPSCTCGRMDAVYRPGMLTCFIQYRCWLVGQ